jgi:hypothetical protein
MYLVNIYYEMTFDWKLIIYNKLSFSNKEYCNHLKRQMNNLDNTFIPLIFSNYYKPKAVWNRQSLQQINEKWFENAIYKKVQVYDIHEKCISIILQVIKETNSDRKSFKFFSWL